MMENAKIARLWQGFHHLSEDDKDLVLTLTEAVKYSERQIQTVSEQAGCFHNGTLQGKGEWE